jgi:xyloglucan-specific exo-beta-1,4-glucanase
VPPGGAGTATPVTTPAANGTTTPPATQPTPQPATADKTPPAPAAAAPSGAGAGTILREWWTGIGGKSIGDLTGSKHFKDKPDGQELLKSLDAPRQFGSDYGTRIRGYLHPPVTGDYRFWIASDDSSQLWLSSDANPANKKQIAGVTEWTSAQQWDRFTAQQSQVIRLQAGQRYYLEVLHKQGDQKDNLSVAWQIPGGERQVIDGQYLSPPE